MNTTKRLISVLMCIAMLLSSMSSFGFALGTDVGTAENPESTVGKATQTGYVSNGTLGANPTTDVADPVIDADTIVIDTTAVEGGAYTLTFNNLDTSKWTAEYGTNLFTSISAAKEFITVGGTVLVKSCEAAPSGDVAANYYTEAYNTMPYIVGIKADGSDWAENPAFLEKAVVVDSLVAQTSECASAINWYGFACKTHIDFSNAPATGTSTSVVNCRILTGANPTFKTDSNKYNGIYTTITIKNVYLAPSASTAWASSACLINGYTPQNVIIDGLYADAKVADFQTATDTVKQYFDTSLLEVKNSNIRNMKTDVLAAHGKAGSNYVTATSDRKLYVHNNIFANAASSIISPLVIYLDDVALCDNYITMTSASPVIGTAALNYSANTNYAPTVWTVKNNYIVGASDNFLLNTKGTTGRAKQYTTVDIADNYLASAAGAPAMNLGAAGNGYFSKSYYVDSAMTVNNDAIDMTAIASKAGNRVVVQGARIYTTGTAADLDITLPTGVTAEWYSDAAFETKVDAANITAAGKYYLKLTNGTDAIGYIVTLVDTTNAYKGDAEGIIKDTAVYVNSDVGSVAVGETYSGSWLGQTYTFVRGFNAFYDYCEAENYFRSLGITDGQVMIIDLAAGAQMWLAYPVSYYTQNYNVSPVLDLDTPDADGTDKQFNSAANNSAYYINADGIYVNDLLANGTYIEEGELPEGKYGIYGFVVGYEFHFDTISNVDIHLKNTWFSLSCGSTYGLNGIFDGVPESRFKGSSAAQQRALEKLKASTAKLTVENFYCTFWNVGTQYARLFKTGDTLANTVIKNAFFDMPTAHTTKNNTYAYQVADNSYFEISDTLLKNYWNDTTTYLSIGTATDPLTAAQNKQVVYKDNTFVNSKLSNDCIIPMHTDLNSSYTITGNKVYTDESKAVPLFGQNNTYPSGKTSSVPCKLVVKDNIELYGKAAIDLNSETFTDDSVVEANYLVTSASNAFGSHHEYTDGGEGLETYCWCDAERTVKCTEVELKSVDLRDGAMGSILLDAKTSIISFNYLSDTESLADIVYEAPENTTVTFMEFAQGAYQEIPEDELIDCVADMGTAYLKVQKNGTDVYKLYTITFVAPSKNLFKDVFKTDGYIDPAKALLLTSEVAEASEGSVVTVKWKGIEYDFVVGISAFGKLADLEAYAKAEGIDTPHILVKDTTEYLNGAYRLFLTAPAHVFTQNYDANPIKKGTEKDGSDWTFNEGTESGQWNPDYVVKYAEVGTSSSIPEGGYPAGEYYFYGFTLTYFFRDTIGNQADVKLINTHFATQNWSNPVADSIHSYGGNPFIVLGNKGDYTPANSQESINPKQKLTVENLYISLDSQGVAESQKDNCAGTLISGVVPEDVVFDSLFVDIPETNAIYTTSYTINRSEADSSFVIKDSLFRNMRYVNAYFGGATVKAGSSNTVTVTNNIFYNSSFRTHVEGDNNTYDGVISYAPNSLTGLTITDNYVVAPNSTRLISSTGAGDIIEGAPFKLVITGNYVDNLIENKSDIKDRNYTDDSVIENNFYRVGNNTYGTYSVIRGELQTQVDGEGNIYMYSEKWYVDEAMTLTSDKLHAGYTFNGEAFAAEMAYTAGVKDTKLDIAALIDSKGNYITAYSDAECTIPVPIDNYTVPAVGGTVYLKVTSADGILVGLRESPVTAASEEDDQIYKLVISRASGTFVNNIGMGAKADPVTSGKYWVSWRGEYTVTGAGAETIDTNNHRVGAIYYSDILYNIDNVTTNIDDIKAAIVDGMNATGATLDSVYNVVNDINEEREAAKIDMVLALSKDKTLVWNNEAQSYGYYYNFNIPANYYRGVIMYVVYEDANGDIQVEFSDAVIQQAK